MHTTTFAMIISRREEDWESAMGRKLLFIVYLPMLSYFYYQCFPSFLSFFFIQT